MFMIKCIWNELSLRAVVWLHFHIDIPFVFVVDVVYWCVVFNWPNKWTGKKCPCKNKRCACPRYWYWTHCSNDNGIQQTHTLSGSVCCFCCGYVCICICCYFPLFAQYVERRICTVCIETKANLTFALIRHQFSLFLPLSSIALTRSHIILSYFRPWSWHTHWNMRFKHTNCIIRFDPFASF